MPRALSTGASGNYLFNTAYNNRNAVLETLFSFQSIKLVLAFHCTEKVWSTVSITQSGKSANTASTFTFSASPWRSSSGQRNLNLAKNFVLRQWRWFKCWGASQTNTDSPFIPGWQYGVERQPSTTLTVHKREVHRMDACRYGISPDTNWTAGRNTVLQTA